MPDKSITLSPGYKKYGAFILGLSTAIALRAIIILEHIQPGWVRPAWYFAVLGNFLFFYYRYQIAEKRKRAIREHKLIEKVEKLDSLTENDREVLIYLLNSVTKSPEHLNYLIIFVFSLVAIAIDLAFVFFS
ncbi:MAG: hypothetical protein Q7K29_01420 [Thermoleophilia bacterium]|nr:hypothetical protein [Thermoleophilia bacterium]